MRNLEELIKKHLYHFGFYKATIWVWKRAKYLILSSLVVVMLAIVYFAVVLHDLSPTELILAKIATYYAYLFIGWVCITAIDRIIILSCLEKIYSKWLDYLGLLGIGSSKEGFNEQLKNIGYDWAV